MIFDLYKKILFYIGIIYFSILLKKEKLVSSENEYYELKKFIKKNQNVIDVGANIGRYSFKLSDLVGKKGLVYAFEPMEKCYITLLSLINFSNKKNILPFNLAISDKTTFVRMKEIESKNDNNYLFGTQTESRIVKSIKNSNIKYSIRLDDIKFNKKISFIKIDCEGSEVQVLKGAKNIIKKNKPIILVEYNSPKIISFLKSIDYREIITNKKSRNKLFVYKKNYDV